MSYFPVTRPVSCAMSAAPSISNLYWGSLALIAFRTSGSYPCGSTPMAPHDRGLDSAAVAILIVRTEPEVWAWLAPVVARAMARPPATAKPNRRRRVVDVMEDMSGVLSLLEGMFGLEELGKARAGRRLEDLGRVALGGDDAPIHEDDPVRDILRELHLMGHEE